MADRLRQSVDAHDVHRQADAGPWADAGHRLAKGNRSPAVTAAYKKHGGFYLGSIGGPAAILAKNNIKKVEVLEYPELGMEAVWKIEVEDFPAFVVVDDKGNDFFAEVMGEKSALPIVGSGGNGEKV